MGSVDRSMNKMLMWSDRWGVKLERQRMRTSARSIPSTSASKTGYTYGSTMSIQYRQRLKQLKGSDPDEKESQLFHL